MSEYQGIKYVKLSDGKWRLSYPSGYKGIVEAIDEEELKKKIDQMRTQLGV